MNEICKIKLPKIYPNLPNIPFVIGRLYFKKDEEYFIDNTIGPEFTIVAEDDEDMHLINFATIILRCWNIKKDQLISEFYRRTLRDYNNEVENHDIFRKYHNSSRLFELSNYSIGKEIDYSKYEFNPNLQLNSSNLITIELISPCKIDVKKSQISLSVLKGKLKIMSL